MSVVSDDRILDTLSAVVAQCIPSSAAYTSYLDDTQIAQHELAAISMSVHVIVYADNGFAASSAARVCLFSFARQRPMDWECCDSPIANGFHPDLLRPS
jgi:hypothetical protein